MIRQATRYKDSLGRTVRVGDKIEFIFWETGPDGLQHEKVHIGRIRRRKGVLVFCYKVRHDKYSEHRLSCLNFNSTTDWTVLTM